MVITRTPFRISFLGGGTDYPVWYEKNGGAVLSVSIDKYCYVTCRYLPPFFDYKYRLRYREQEEVKTITQIKHPSARECLAYLKFDKGIEMQHNADVPGMSGLGSSCSFTVGFLNALYALRGKEVSKRQLALDAIHIEQERIKENVGSQDQTVAAFGGFNRIEFGGKQKIKVMPVAIDDAVNKELERSLMLFFTGFSRNASDIALEQIKTTPRKSGELKKMQTMVGEGEKILLGGSKNLNDFGRLLHEGWLIKRSLTSKITNSSIDDIYSKARSAGAIGGKLLGAGGGGFMLLFAPPERQKAVRKILKNFLHVPFRFENTGSQIIYRMPNYDEYQQYI